MFAAITEFTSYRASIQRYAEPKANWLKRMENELSPKKIEYKSTLMLFDKRVRPLSRDTCKLNLTPDCRVFEKGDYVIVVAPGSGSAIASTVSKNLLRSPQATIELRESASEVSVATIKRYAKMLG